MNIPLKTGIGGISGGPTTVPAILPPSPASTPSASHLVIDPTAVAEMLFNTMVLYGPTGTRKTTQIGEFAKYIYQKTGKKTRLISMDGGGWGPIQDLINAGIIDAWRMVEEANPKVAIIKASKGAWPVELRNGLRVGSKIYEPTLGEQRTKAMADVGAVAVEGWSSIARAVIRDLVSKGQKISEDIVGKFTETADFGGSETFGAPGRSHFGFVQNYILDMIRNFSALPVERILYTSLEGRGEDNISRALSYGPDVAGKAITAAIPTYVGDCLHFEDFTEVAGPDPANPTQKLVEAKVRVWFTQHPDPQTGVMWPAKPRTVGSKYEEFRKRVGGNGYFVLGKDAHLGTYLGIQDELLAGASEEAREWKAMIDAKRGGK